MQSGAPALRSVMDASGRFLAWWREELWAMVPERVRRLLAGADGGIVLAQVEGGFQIVEEPSSGARGRAGAARPVLSRAEALAALAEMAVSRGPKSASWRVGIRLPSSQCFERRVELPRAARDDMRRMLDFDLERATPFRLGDVYTAHLATGAPGAKGRQRLRQLIVKREAVDTLLADVRAAGLEPAFVDCWQATPSAGLPIDFLEAGGAPRSGLAGRVTLPTALAALVLILAVLASILELSRYNSALAEIRAETAKMRTRAATVRGAQERSNAAVADLARLQQMKLAQVPAVEVLEELSRLLPDSVWLSDLRVEGDTLDITGLAKSGAALPSLFVRSALFSDAALTAPVDSRPARGQRALQPARAHRAARGVAARRGQRKGTVMRELSQPVRRLAALGLLVLALAILASLTVVPLTARVAGLSGEIETERALLGRFAAVAARQGETEELERLGRSARESGAWLQGESEALTAAGLQGLLARLAAANRVRFHSTRALPPRERDALRLIGVSVQFKAGIEELRAILFRIESNRPFLFVEGLQVRPLSPFSQRDTELNGVLDVRLERLRRAVHEEELVHDSGFANGESARGCRTGRRRRPAGAPEPPPLAHPRRTSHPSPLR